VSLRTRIALLVGLTVLVASAIGGIGTSVSSRSVGQDRLDRALLDDASQFAQFELDSSRVVNQLQFVFDARRVTCDVTADELAEPLAQPGQAAPAVDPPNASGRRGNRLRLLPEFASSIQLIGMDGTSTAPCQALPITASDTEIARAGTGTAFRTASVDGERFRILTQGYADVGAIQFARSLTITEDTLRSLLVRSVLFGVIGAGLAAALGWLFARRATEPVHQLSAAAERVSRTRDLGERIEVVGPAEIRTLASSFNTMLASLDTSRAQQQQLVQDASHELRTPLTSMRTNVELLQRHANMEDAVRAEILRDVKSELIELTDLTAELVESATEVPFDVQTATVVDLHEVAATCVARAQRRHPRVIELEVANGTDAQVFADSTLLARAISNLLNNAVKFSDSDSLVVAQVVGTDFTVVDRGPGIPEHDLPHIFERFYRATTARSAPGSGLGLAIVKQIVEGHGGSVHASNRPDGGARIGFSLPPAAAEVDRTQLIGRDTNGQAENI